MSRLGRLGSSVAAALAVAALAACGGDGGGSPTDTLEEVTGGEVTPDVLAEEGGEAEPDAVVTDNPADAPDDAAVEGGGDIETADGPCTEDSQCPSAGLGPCQIPACNDGVCGFSWDKGCCLDNRDAPFLYSSFEDGLPAGWVATAGEANGAVKWSVVGTRATAGSKSLYFGNPDCATYYSGALNEECQPVDPTGADATRVYGSVTTSKFLLPDVKGRKFLSFALFSEVEPYFVGLPDEVQSDILKVFVVVDPGQPSENTDMVFTSLGLPEKKQTGGKFAFVIADLSAYAGREIAVKLLFDTSDGTNNLFEGVYIDDLAVYSDCDPDLCDAGSTCAADGKECTDDACVPFSNQSAQGICAYWEDPLCKEPVCTPTNLSKCPPKEENPECWDISCPAGECVYTLRPDCCESGSRLAVDFENGSLNGFITFAYRDNQKVKWQVTSRRAASGKYSLYYGDVVSGTYFSDETFNFGEATSPEINLTADVDYYFLSFNLYLSTEFNDVLPADYYNPLGTDLFEVLVVQNAGKPTETAKRVWSSDNIQGTTLGKSDTGFIPVGIDLTEFKGKKVWIRFAFNTGDAIKNAFEGVYVDDISVTYDCKLHNCKGTYDCGYDGVCKLGSCEEEVCTPDSTNPPADDCCAVTEDCDDGDECTTDGCIGNHCYHDFVESPNCCREEVFFEQLFDSAAEFDLWAVVDTGTPGEGGQVVTWRYSDKRFKGDKPGAAYFGDAEGTTCDNLGTAHATLTSPEFQVPTYGVLNLGFWMYMDVDPAMTYNTITAEVVPVDDAISPRKVFEKTEGMVFDTWFEVSGVDLGDFKAQKVKLRFTFDGVHHEGTDHGTGVFVDSIVGRKVCPQL